ncbi:MAG TPA: M48 family metallopeptidase [Burkholderiaceae bacterium]|nr:M48 family metallopeptidase [Burkholderiaceae bacterium]
MIAAYYFDGSTGKRHPAELNIGGGTIRVLGADMDRSYGSRSAYLAEPFERAHCVLGFADGSRCEVHDPVAKIALLSALHYRKSFVERCQDRWWGALLAIVVMLLTLFSIYHWGIPWAADRIAQQIPLEWERKIGDTALTGLDQQFFQPSQLIDERQQEAQEIFTKLIPRNTRMPMRLVFRASKLAGPNAFALPNGTIVVTDAMVDHITGVGSGLTGGLADELAGVLAHEIGHVQGRHSLKKLAQTSITGALSWALFGDFSAVAAGAPTILLRLQYSRAMETEADDYAAAVLKLHGISPVCLAELFDSLEKGSRRSPNALGPNWLRRATDYLSTHPSNQERMARLRRAVQH